MSKARKARKTRNVQRCIYLKLERDLKDSFLINHSNTIKLLYSRHHSDLKIVSVTERSLLHRSYSQKLAHFASKTYQVQSNQPTKMSRGWCWKRKKSKAIYQMISCLYYNLEATGYRVFAIRERADQRSGQGSCCSGWY